MPKHFYPIYCLSNCHVFIHSFYIINFIITKTQTQNRNTTPDTGYHRSENCNLHTNPVSLHSTASIFIVGFLAALLVTVLADNAGDCDHYLRDCSFNLACFCSKLKTRQCPHDKNHANTIRQVLQTIRIITIKT
jgi:hypothetical protein